MSRFAERRVRRLLALEDRLRFCHPHMVVGGPTEIAVGATETLRADPKGIFRVHRIIIPSYYQADLAVKSICLGPELVFENEKGADALFFGELDRIADVHWGTVPEDGLIAVTLHNRGHTIIRAEFAAYGVRAGKERHG